MPPPDPPEEEAQNTPPKLAETSSAKHVEPQSPSFMTRLKAVAAALWSEMRRVAKLTALKMRLTRLKGVDLKAAHYAFGKECYELGLQKEKFATEFTSIGELQKQIAEKKAGKASEAQETNTQKAKRVFGNLSGKAEAFFLARRLKKQLIAFGQVVVSEESSDVAQAELERVKMVQRQIAKSEDEHAALCKDNRGAPIHPARYWGVVLGAVLLVIVGASFTFHSGEGRHSSSGLSIAGQADIQQIENSVDQEDGKAAYMLARKYRYGHDVAIDDGKALQYMQEAASQGYAKAQYQLGSMYYDGVYGVKKDLTLAAQWFEKSAVQGFAHAQLAIGLMYYTGYGVQENEGKGIEWLQKAAAQGNEAAQGYLSARNIANGPTIESRPPTVDSPNSDAQQKHALIEYAEGAPEPTDLAKGISWFENAAAQGNAKAQLNLGYLYMGGRGVPEDEAKAIKWYQASAKQGNDIAQYKLGYYYLNGIGVPKDHAKAFEWFKKAADQENLNALNFLGLMYCEGHFVTQDKYKAIVLWQRAAMQGHSIAQSSLAFAYQVGDGIPKDYISAFAWYTVKTKNVPAHCLEEQRRLASLKKIMTEAEIAKAVELSEDLLKKMRKR